MNFQLITVLTAGKSNILKPTHIDTVSDCHVCVYRKSDVNVMFIFRKKKNKIFMLSYREEVSINTSD